MADKHAKKASSLRKEGHNLQKQAKLRPEKLIETGYAEQQKMPPPQLKSHDTRRSGR
jgi:hypothetical protein